MSSQDLVVNGNINGSYLQVADQSGSKSALWVASSAVLVGSGNPDSRQNVLTVAAVPQTHAAHVIFGDPKASAGEPSAKLTFAGWDVGHAGFAWLPSVTQGAGRLNLAFGGNDDPSLNTPQFSFFANGSLTANGTISAGGLNVSGPLTLSSSSVSLTGLSTPPAGTATVDVVVDPKTGRLYRQS